MVMAERLERDFEWAMAKAKFSGVPDAEDVPVPRRLVDPWYLSIPRRFRTSLRACAYV